MKKIESSKNIPAGSVLRLHKKGYGYGRIEILTNSPLFIAALPDKDLYDSIKENEQAEAYYWVPDKGAYEFQTTLIGRTVNEPGLLFFSHSDSVTYSHDRKCLSAKVNIPFKYFILNSKDRKKSFSSDEIVYLNGAVIELSDREAMIISDEQLDDGIYIFGHIAIGGNTIEMIGRKESIPGGEPGRFRITFSGMLVKERERILEYVYTIYRE